MHFKTLNLDKDLMLLRVQGSNQTSHTPGVCPVGEAHEALSTKDFMKLLKNWLVFFSFFLSCTSQIFQNFEYNYKSMKSQQAGWQFELQIERKGLGGNGQPYLGLRMCFS